MNIERICCMIGGAVLLSLCGARAQERLPLSLARCREMALSHSEELRQADLALRRAELDNQIASTARLPRLEGSATGAYVLPDMELSGMELRMRGVYMAGLSLTQPLYTGGKITAGKRLARIGESVAGTQRSMTRMDVLVEADNAYWTCIAIDRKVRMMESYCLQMDTLYRQVAAAREVGMATDNDLLRVEAERSNVLYQTQKARNGADLCRMSLCRVIGADFDTRVVPTDTLFAVSSSAAPSLVADIGERPELRLLQDRVAAGKQQLRMAQADLLPTVGLTAGYTYYGNFKLNGMADVGGTMIPYTQEYRDGMGVAMLAVKVPIFHWGEGRKKVKKARCDLYDAELELQKSSRLLSLEVEQAIRNVEDGYLLIRTAETGLHQAVEHLRVTRNRYQASMAPLSDLLDAQSQWQQAESNLIEAQTQYRIYETEYLRAAGKLN